MKELRFVRERQVDRFERRELAREMEDARRRVNLGRGFEQQELERRMQVAPYRQASLRRHEHHVGRWDVACQVHDAGRQHTFGQDRNEGDERVGAWKAAELDSWRVQQPLHDR